MFFPAQNSFWTCWFGCLLALLTFFVSLLPHPQNISLWGLFFSWGNKNKVARGKIDWIGRVENRAHAVFGQTLLGLRAHKSPIMKWANTLKESSKNSLKLNIASHNNASWDTDSDAFPDHSPSGGSLYYKGLTLQKIILFWGGEGHPLYTYGSKLTIHALCWRHFKHDFEK